MKIEFLINDEDRKEVEEWIKELESSYKELEVISKAKIKEYRLLLNKTNDELRKLKEMK